MSAPAAIKNARLLLVEDRSDLAATIASYLEAQGYIMDFAADGLTGLTLATTQNYDLIILDLMLPKLSGMEVCQRLRADGKATPVLMLTARDQLTDKLEGFNAGADDYLLKPFEFKELAARIVALIRRQRGEIGNSVLKVGELEYDTDLVRVRRGRQTLDLSPTCLRILKILMRESPKVISRDILEKELWGDRVPDSDTLRSHLYNLRKALDRPFEAKMLHTVQGMGFKLVAPGE